MTQVAYCVIMFNTSGNTQVNLWHTHNVRAESKEKDIQGGPCKQVVERRVILACETRTG